MKRFTLAAALVISTLASTTAQGPKTHRLEATPATVAYGHYWAETKPVLTINSGDIIDVDTLLTSTPDRLEKSGVPAADDSGLAARDRRAGEGSRARRPYPDRSGVRRPARNRATRSK